MSRENRYVRAASGRTCGIARSPIGIPARRARATESTEYPEKMAAFLSLCCRQSKFALPSLANTNPQVRLRAAGQIAKSFEKIARLMELRESNLLDREPIAQDHPLSP